MCQNFMKKMEDVWRKKNGVQVDPKDTVTVLHGSGIRLKVYQKNIPKFLKICKQPFNSKYAIIMKSFEVMNNICHILRLLHKNNTNYANEIDTNLLNSSLSRNQRNSRHGCGHG
jgi:hypothetical protein